MMITIYLRMSSVVNLRIGKLLMRSYGLFTQVAIQVMEAAVCWHIRHDALVQTPGQASPTKRNMQKYFFGD